MDSSKMCHLKVVMNNGRKYEQQNLMFSDIEIDSGGITVKTQLGMSIYHKRYIEAAFIEYINDEKSES